MGNGRPGVAPVGRAGADGTRALMAGEMSINAALLDHIPLTARHVLEIGCGDGVLGARFRARQPLARYVGVDPRAAVAGAARRVLDAVVCAGVDGPEGLAAIDDIRAGAGFDAVVLTDGVAGLGDPGEALAALRSRTVAGGACVVALANPAHWRVLAAEAETEAGGAASEPGDPRFGALERAIETIRTAGWTFVDAVPRVAGGAGAEAAMARFAPLAGRPGMTPQRLRRDLSVTQWVIRAVNGAAPARFDIVGMGLAKIGGVTEARIDHPLAALRSLPGVRAAWDAGGAPIPRAFEPGIFVLHRQFLDDPAFVAGLDGLIAKGWVIVSEIDDDPQRWPEYAAAGFRAFRGVHAVTVSTERLADTIRAWNPHVAVFPNAIFELPPAAPEVPEQGVPKADGRLRIFFGALNRGGDWAAVRDGVLAAAAALGDAAEFVIVHDRAIHDDLPAPVRRSFHPTLPYDRYMAVLASCDVALLPLEDSAFNRHKSDLKFIECCAAGVVPVCSPVVYADRAEHHAIGLFATSAQEWQAAIERLGAAPEEIARRRALGLAYAGGMRMHAQQAAARAAFYRDLLSRRGALEAERLERLAALSR